MPPRRKNITLKEARRLASDVQRESAFIPLEPILFVPDTHIPYQHQPSWELMLQVAHDLGPKHIVVIGDLADFFTVSDHLKDPRRALRLEYEMEQVNEKLDELDALGAEYKLFIAGNHEDRLRRFLEEKAPEIFGFVDVPRLLKLEERGWQYTPYKQYAKLGKLYLTHDVGTSGRLAVFKASETFEHSVVTGHTHRLAYIVNGNATGEYKVSAQFGWLGDVEQVDYMHLASAKKDWALGFGIGYLDPATGYVYLAPVPIVRGTCVVNGVKYEAA